MKFLFALASVIGLPAVANAHMLDEHRSLFDQLAHQLVGVHHLPGLAIIVLAAWVLWRVVRNDRA